MVAHAARLFLAAILSVAPTTAHAQPSTPSIAGAWTGTYTCSQGLTGLTLTLQSQDAKTFSGYFHFYPPPSNAGAKEGCFSVRAQITSNGTIAIEAVRWMTQPEGYVTVDLAGRTDAPGEVMTGTVIAPPGFGAICTVFDIRRQTGEARVSPLCHAGVAALR